MLSATTCEAPEIGDLSDNEDELVKQVILLVKSTSDWGRRGTDYFCRLGYALAKLKMMYFKTCSICVERKSDMFTILSCERCAKASDSSVFFEVATKATTYKKDYINFLIRAAGLYVEFPKFKLTVWNSTDLKKYMAYLPGKMEGDKNIWM